MKIRVPWDSIIVSAYSRESDVKKTWYTWQEIVTMALLVQHRIRWGAFIDGPVDLYAPSDEMGMPESWVGWGMEPPLRENGRI